MTLLEDLWYGNIDPHEAILQNDKQFKNLLSLMGKTQDKLSDTLTERQKETLEKYDAAVNEMHSLAELSAFRYGFSLGVRLIAESISIQLTNEN
jgi:hypothetical protein